MSFVELPVYDNLISRILDDKNVFQRPRDALLLGYIIGNQWRAMGSHTLPPPTPPIVMRGNLVGIVLL